MYDVEAHRIDQGENTFDDMSSTGSLLTKEQTRALFDILTHHETYAEIESFKTSHGVTGYGFPFRSRMTAPAGGGSGLTTTTPLGTAPNTPRSRTPIPPSERQALSKEEQEKGEEDGEDGEDDNSAHSSSPILQMLLARFVLPLPGVRDLPRDFWAIRVQGLLARLGDAELSESYDKGALGTRKTLATGASALVEMLGRGALGGVPRSKDQGSESSDANTDRHYDSGNADDLFAAWDDVLQQLVYGNLVDEVFDHLSKTDDMESYSPAVKAAVEYAIFHIATFAHEIFILSPEGQYLLKLGENVHNLVPFKMVKQTLRVGNAATMISGMMRLLLAKLSVTSVTNWFGLTQNPDDGMNLLQRIISLVLSWDSSEFKKGADKIERAKDRPTEEMLQVIRQHIDGSRQEHEAIRAASMEHSQSIITAIFNASNPDLTASLTETQHTQCLEYYSAHLSVRDRESITTTFCRQPPDLFTQMIKDVVAAYEPMIRNIHSRVDLREHLDSYQGFVDDFIKASKPKKVAGDGEEKLASVEDYVRLLMKNRGLLFKWIHSLAEKCPDVWEDFRSWAKGSAAKFQQQSAPQIAEEKEPGSKTSKSDSMPDQSLPSVMDGHLQTLFASIDPSAQKAVIATIDAHAEYLSTLAAVSHARLQYLVTSSDSAGDSTTGPGVYLARWGNLLDETTITPASSNVETTLRYGRDVKHLTTMGKTGVDGKKSSDDAQTATAATRDGPRAPDVSVIIKELGSEFKHIIREVGK